MLTDLSVAVEQHLSPSNSTSRASEAGIGSTSSEGPTTDSEWDALGYNDERTSPSSSFASGQILEENPLPSVSIPNLPLTPETLQSSEHHQCTIEGGIVLSELVKAELTQVYFDRVQPNIPILCQSKTYSWICEPSSIDKYQQCLQYAIWTSASAFSGQFESVREKLYTTTRWMLDGLDLKDGDMTACRIEHIQSWILITFFEFAKTHYRRAWLSAGRVFRLVQLLRLYDVDNPKFNKPSEVSDVEKEERRRTFWVAYCLDRLISVSNATPVTLGEEVVGTRLPCLDADFQAGNIRIEHFLSEAISSVDLRLYSPLAECVILVTISSRALTHKQVSDVEIMYGSAAPRDFCARHEWLSSMLTRRIESINKNYPSLSPASDPMIMFAYMVAHTTVMYLYCIMEPFSNDESYGPLPWDFLERGLAAAQEVACLAKKQQPVGYFRMHIFMPLPIYLSIVKLKIYLGQRRKAGYRVDEIGPIEKSLQASLDALQRLQSVNNLACYYLGLLDGNKDLIGLTINDGWVWG